MTETPQETSERLVEKFKLSIGTAYVSSDEYAQKCAKITCNEQIQMIREILKANSIEDYLYEKCEELIEVKKCIELM